MNIGTPYTPAACRVMLLGSGELGKEVIIALQRFGVEVIAVDRYLNAPGHQVAHRVHHIDMTDGAALKELVGWEKPHIIVPEIEAIDTDALFEIEQAGISTIIPNAHAVRQTMNREWIRKLAAEELDLSTSRYIFADNVDDLRTGIENNVGYPCFIKPVMSSSGKGQSRIETADEIQAAWDYAMQTGRVNKGKVIAEAEIDFDFEITLLTVRTLTPSGKIETHFCAPIGHYQERGDYVQSWQPQPMTPLAVSRAENIAKQITDALGGCGIFGVEMFVKDNHVWFSEVSPRPHDTGMVTMVTQAQSEFALHARAMLNLPVDTRLLSPGASAVIYGGIDTQEGVAYSGLAEALQVPETEVRLFGKPESYVYRRMGVALARGKDVDQALARAKKAAACVKPEIAEM